MTTTPCHTLVHSVHNLHGPTTPRHRPRGHLQATHNRGACQELGNSCFGLERRSVNLVSSNLLFIVIRLDGSAAGDRMESSAASQTPRPTT